MKKALWLIGIGLVIIGITLWRGDGSPLIFVFTLMGFISLFIGVFKIFNIRLKKEGAK